MGLDQVELRELCTVCGRRAAPGEAACVDLKPELDLAAESGHHPSAVDSASPVEVGASNPDVCLTHINHHKARLQTDLFPCFTLFSGTHEQQDQ